MISGTRYDGDSSVDLAQKDFILNSSLSNKKFDLIIHSASYAQPNLYK